MKKNHLIICLALAALLIFNVQCKKENTCEDCQTIPPTTKTNKSPVAIAGSSQTVILPIDMATLDGSGSSDPDGKIASWQWTKISGPSSFVIEYPDLSITQVRNLAEGIYLFELKITDDSGSVARDTVNITVSQFLSDPINVLVAGSKNGVAQYWKNGIVVALPNGTSAKSIYVSGDDVYVAGQEYHGGGIYQTAKYWKNGTAFNLTDGTGYAGANDVFAVGNDTYVAGWGSGGITQAKYWKNGNVVNLPTGWEATSIYVSGNDVYVGGYDSGQVAKYWKNGIGVSLGDASDYSSVNDIFVSGNDVFMAGSAGEKVFYDSTYWEPGPLTAVYWKNGIAINLQDGSQAFSIYVSGNDVYVAGRFDDGYETIAKYWKNGISFTLPNGTQAKSIYVLDNDVYVAGDNNGKAKYWKNGVEVSLDGESSWANSIVVIPR